MKLQRQEYQHLAKVADWLLIKVKGNDQYVSPNFFFIMCFTTKGVPHSTGRKGLGRFAFSPALVHIRTLMSPLSLNRSHGVTNVVMKSVARKLKFSQLRLF